MPIITGIGHERDDTVIDMVAHTRVKTPTAAAEFLVNHLRQTAERLDNFIQYIYQEVPQRIVRERERLDGWLARIPSKIQLRIQQESFIQERFARRIGTALQTRFQSEKHRQEICLQRMQTALRVRMQTEKHRIELYSERIKAASPDILLKRGYSMTLKNGKAVTDASRLRPGDTVETRLAKGSFKSKVI